jgi:flagellar hook-associated protein 2
LTSSIDGLVSGLSTSSMISALMKVEAAPQDRLKTKVNTAQTAVASYQSVNSKLSALKSAADDLGQLSTWRAVKPTSSSSSVTATAVGGVNTVTGTMTFDVVGLAKGQVSTTRVDPQADITSAESISVTVGSGDPVTVDLFTTDADGNRTYTRTAQGVADAINKKGIGVKAAVITTGGSQNVLQLSGTRTGAANSFTVAGLEDTGLAQTVAAADAKLQVGGTDEQGGFSVTSTSNTFTGLMAGVTLTVSAEEKNVTVTSASDVSGIAAKVQAMVDAANATLTEISGQTAYDASTKTSSPLTGDFSVRQMSQEILGAVSRGLSFPDPDSTSTPPATIDFGSLSKLGIQLNRSGQLTFDASKFTAKYNEDPTAIKKAGMALADTFETMATRQSTNITSVITGRKSEIDSMTSQISDWDIRLTAKREALQKTYSDLETSLSNLKSQSTWLSGQIASLG